MKSMILVALALVAVSAAAPVDEPVQIVKSNFNQEPNGDYNFAYESADGSVRQEGGQLKEVLDEDNKPHNVVVVRGSYSYISPEGVQDSITYFADETGFHAEGPSIPQPPARR